MPSFDVVSEVDMHEAQNAVNQANQEVTNRFDFKDSNANYELKESAINLSAQNEFQIKQMAEVLESKLIKRGIQLGSLEYGEIRLSGNAAQQEVKIQQGIETSLAKQIVKTIKNAKMKVQASIQGEQVRVTGKKRDDLQEVIELLKEEKISLPLQFINFRD